MPDPTRLHGVIPPVVTPLTVDDDVDELNLAQLVDHFIVAGADGVFVLGTTGEGAFLTDSQRERVVAAAVRSAAGRVPVLAGAPDVGSDRVVAHARTAISAGADHIVVTAPLYGHASTVETFDHFVRVAEAVEAPVVAYDNPDVVGNRLSARMIIMLAYEGMVFSLKDSSGDLLALREIINDTSNIDGFSVFTGSPTLADVALWLGAGGIVPGLGNVDIDGYVRLCRHARAGNWESARAEQHRLIRLNQIGSVADNRRVGHRGAVGAIKEAMLARGLLGVSATCPPYVRYEPTEASQIGEILTEVGLDTFTR